MSLGVFLTTSVEKDLFDSLGFLENILLDFQYFWKWEWISQREVLLGSKTLGTKCIRTSMCIVLANHDQNLESRFRLLKVCLFVKLESSELQNLLSKSTRLNRSNLVQIYFLRIFQTQPKPSLTCRVLYFTPSIKGKTLAMFQRLLMCCVLNLL